MNPLTVFGVMVVIISLVCFFYLLQSRSKWGVLGFGLSGILVAIYEFLDGNWWFGVFGAVWSLIGLGRWWLGRNSN
ncbi:hypothetical protein [Spirosoma aerolatum]|uniref:hypothetical protein n=1 Tax=Spirosoma aerolatum TaxID=1211326 RepID=UPI0009AE3F18|nr:hypothetical protein [Spirosoma aerolatum]